MPITNLGAEEVLEYQFRDGSAPALVATWEVALYTASPGYDDSGTEVATGGTNYARQEVDNDPLEWSAAGSNRYVSNVSAIDWGSVTGDWGLVRYVGLIDKATGVLWYFDALDGAYDINDGDTFQLGAGSVRIRLSPA